MSRFGHVMLPHLSEDYLSISFWQNDSADTSTDAGIQSRTLSASCRLLHHSLVVRLVLRVILEVKP